MSPKRKTLIIIGTRKTVVLLKDLISSGKSAKIKKLINPITTKDGEVDRYLIKVISDIHNLEKTIGELYSSPDSEVQDVDIQ